MMLFIRYIQMKSNKNISFAEVLRKKGRPCLNPTDLTLSQIMDQYLMNPLQDFTLKLGSNTQNSVNRLPMSSYCPQDQQEMFDSWIERQTKVNNKENMSFQRRVVNSQQPLVKPPPRQMITQSKGNQAPPTKKNSEVRKISKQPLEQSKKYQLPSHVKMIKSNSSEQHSPQHQQSFPKAPQFGAANFQFEEEENQNEKETQSHQRKRNNVEVQGLGLQQIIQSTHNIHNQIGDLAKKYLEQSDEEVQEEMLIDGSEKKAVIKSNEELQTQTQAYSEKQQQQKEIERKRFEQAKKKLGDIFKNMSKGKQSKNEEEQNSKPSIVVNDKFDVGYSFANGQLIQNQSTSIGKIEHIQEIQSEIPSLAPIEESEDCRFKQKYVNMNSPELLTENIPNIQSVQYHSNSSKPIIQTAISKQKSTIAEQVKLISSQQVEDEKTTEQSINKHKQTDFNKQKTINIITQMPKNTEQKPKCQVKISCQEFKVKQHSEPKTQIESITQVSYSKNEPKIETFQTSKNGCKNNFKNISQLSEKQPMQERKQISSKPEILFEVPSKEIMNSDKNEELELKKQQLSKYFLKENAQVNQDQQPTSTTISKKTVKQVKETIINSIKDAKTNSIKQINISQTEQAKTYPVKEIVLNQRKQDIDHPSNSDKQMASDPVKRVINSKENLFKKPHYALPTTDYKSHYSNLNYPTFAQQDFNPSSNPAPNPPKQKVTLKDKLQIECMGQQVQKRSYLQSLDIKESITLNEVSGRASNRPTFQGVLQSTNMAYRVAGIDKIMKQSLKQSINLATSNEFEFEF